MSVLGVVADGRLDLRRHDRRRLGRRHRAARQTETELFECQSLFKYFLRVQFTKPNLVDLPYVNL